MNPHDSSYVRMVLRDIGRHETRAFFLAFAAVMLAVLSLIFIVMAVFPPWAPNLFIPVLPLQLFAVLLYRGSQHHAALARLLDHNLTEAMRGPWTAGGPVKHRKGS